MAVLSQEAINQASNGSLLDLILEKTTNTEQSINRLDIKSFLAEQLELAARRELKTRSATLTLSINSQDEVEGLTTKIESL